MTKTFKVIIIVDSSLTQQQTYINNQLLAIKKELSDLPIEVDNENSSIFKTYAKHRNRVPCYMIFKNNIFKTCRHNKMSDAEAITWIKRMTS
jgi:hypothetical protein